MRPDKSRLIPFTFFGPAVGTLWPAPPLLGLVASFRYQKDYDIYGYETFFAGLSTFTGPNLAPASYVPLPMIAAILIGISSPTYALQTPTGGNTLENILCTLQGGLSYIPANAASVPARPETFAQGDTVSEFFTQDTIIRIPAQQVVSLYLRLSNNTVWDTAGFQCTLYTLPAS